MKLGEKIRDELPSKKFGLIEARTVSPIGKIMFAFLGGIIGGGATPGAASPHSGRFKGVMGCARGLKGENSEFPLVPS
jgi:hypothetical protein